MRGTDHFESMECEKMTSPTQPENPAVRQAFNRLYRNFFNLAERKRRWSLEDDIPWDQANRAMHPAIADVVETFCPWRCICPITLPRRCP